jgi:hypothetical protein
MGLGWVMSNCRPVLPASWQPMHWSDVRNWLAGVGPLAVAQTES